MTPLEQGIPAGVPRGFWCSGMPRGVGALQGSFVLRLSTLALRLAPPSTHIPAELMILLMISGSGRGRMMIG